MTMRDWIAKLEQFVNLSGRDLLDHAGRISADDAKAKSELEYERHRRLLDVQPRRVDDDFDQAAKHVNKLPKARKRGPAPRTSTPRSRRRAGA